MYVAGQIRGDFFTLICPSTNTVHTCKCYYINLPSYIHIYKLYTLIIHQHMQLQISDSHFKLLHYHSHHASLMSFILLVQHLHGLLFNPFHHPIPREWGRGWGTAM